MNKKTLTPVNTERAQDSYHPNYLKLLKTGRRRKLDADLRREYIRNYMRKYRSRQDVAESENGRAILRRYLIDPKAGSYKSQIKLGISKGEFASILGFDSVEELCSYVKLNEIDHIVTAKFIQTEHPHLIPFLHRYYNLQFIPKKLNRTKGTYVDPENPKVREILCRMNMDLLKSKADFDRADSASMNRLAHQLDSFFEEAA